MTDAQFEILKRKLSNDYVPHLPPLLDQNKPEDHRLAKNISRAFSAFALQMICKLDTVSAAKAVVDDYEDNGLDAIYYSEATRKLFLVQSKLKLNEPFQQEDANSFTKGVRDLLNQRYPRFNKNILDRQAEIEQALDDCNEIVLVIVHSSEIISGHAYSGLQHFLTDSEKPDERLRSAVLDFGPIQVIEYLLSEHALAPVDDDLIIFGHHKIDAPRVTYYGQVQVTALASLFKKHGNALLEKNIRYFLGISSSDVNRAIYRTLHSSSGDFFYLSNGVTAIAQKIELGGVKGEGRKFKITGLSVINGAQTIASCHHFIEENSHVDVTNARVLLTLIQVDQNDTFGNTITRTRNHQNQVALADFAALDEVQERLRRELAFDNIIYRYRPQARELSPGIDSMTIEEASIALALFSPDPAYVVTLKREPATLLDTHGKDYKKIFELNLSGKKLANAVRLFRAVSKILGSNEQASNGLDKIIYQHSRYAIMWLTFQKNMDWLLKTHVISNSEAEIQVSQPLDEWREKVFSAAKTNIAAAGKGPLAFFRNMTDTKPFVCGLRDA